MVKHEDSNSDKFFKLLNAIEPDVSHLHNSSSISHIVYSPIPNKNKRNNNDDTTEIERPALNEEEMLQIINIDATVCSERYPIDIIGLERIYPLHVCCGIKTSLSFIKKVYKSYPEALTAHHGDDSTSSLIGNPLHYCFYYNVEYCTIELIHYLITKYPDCMKECNIKEERTPLHIACMNSHLLLSSWNETNKDIIPYLTEKYPNACRIQDIDGCTPLHLACDMKDAQISVVEDLTEVCPEACIIQSEDLSTPLHLAIQNMVSNIEVIKDLLRTNKMACQIKDDQERYPFHIAYDNLIDYIKSSASGASASYTEILASANQDNNSNNELEHIIYNIIQCLVPKYPDVLEMTYRDGLTPYQYIKTIPNYSSILPNHMIEYLNPYE